MRHLKFALKSILLLPFLYLLLCSSVSAEETPKIALVMKALTNPFFIKLDQSARQYALQNNIPLTVFGLERETDVEQQIRIVEDLIALKTDAIVIAPADSKKLVPVCKKAIEEGIKLINIDNPLDKETLKNQGIDIPFIGPDNFKGGKLIGEYIQKKLNGEGHVLLVEGIPGAFNSDARKNGFIDGLTQKGSIKILDIIRGNWHSEEAFSAIVNRLEKSEQKIDAILCANDVMAQGALQAVDLYNVNGAHSDILITGYDNITPIQDEIANSRIQATIEQYPDIMGKEGIKAAWKALTENGNSLKSHSTPVSLITKDTFGKNILVSVSTLTNEFFKIMIDQVKTEAELHQINLKVVDAENDDAKQLVDIMGSLEMKPDLIIVNPTNSTTISPAIDQANLAAIPIISLDRHLEESKVITNISSDNHMGGRLAADFLIEKLGSKGQILELEGIPGTSAAHDRGAGFNEKINTVEKLSIAYREVGDFRKDRAKSLVKSLLQQGVNIDGVFAHNDAMALGCIEAYEQTGRPLPKVIIGFDGINEAMVAIKNNKLTATVAQQPDLMGRMAIITAASYFRGEKVSETIPIELELLKK